MHLHRQVLVAGIGDLAADALAQRRTGRRASTRNQVPNSSASVSARQTRDRGARSRIFFSMRSVFVVCATSWLHVTGSPPEMQPLGCPSLARAAAARRPAYQPASASRQSRASASPASPSSSRSPPRRRRRCRRKRTSAPPPRPRASAASTGGSPFFASAALIPGSSFAAQASKSLPHVGELARQGLGALDLRLRRPPSWKTTSQ